MGKKVLEKVMFPLNKILVIQISLQRERRKKYEKKEREKEVEESGMRGKQIEEFFRKRFESLMEWKNRKKVLHILMNHFFLSLSLFSWKINGRGRRKNRKRKREKSNAFFHEGNFLNTNKGGMK